MQNLKFLSRLAWPTSLNNFVTFTVCKVSYFGTISSKSLCLEQTLHKSKLTSTSSFVSQIFRSSSSRISSGTEKKWMKYDEVSANFKLIYRAPMYNYVLASHSMVVFGPLLMVVGFLARVGLKGYFPVDLELVIWTSAFVAFNFSVLRILSMYVLRIYSDENGSYIMVKSGTFPSQISKYSYSEGQLQKLEPTGYLPWQFSRFTLDGKKSIILDYYFRKPSDLFAMLGKNNVSTS